MPADACPRKTQSPRGDPAFTARGCEQTTRLRVPLACGNQYREFVEPPRQQLLNEYCRPVACGSSDRDCATAAPMARPRSNRPRDRWPPANSLELRLAHRALHKRLEPGRWCLNIHSPFHGVVSIREVTPIHLEITAGRANPTGTGAVKKSGVRQARTGDRNRRSDPAVAGSGQIPTSKFYRRRKPADKVKMKSERFRQRETGCAKSRNRSCERATL